MPRSTTSGLTCERWKRDFGSRTRRPARAAPVARADKRSAEAIRHQTTLRLVNAKARAQRLIGIDPEIGSGEIPAREGSARANVKDRATAVCLVRQGNIAHRSFVPAKTAPNLDPTAPLLAWAEPFLHEST